jgi:plasmid maintenance system killer protein
LNVIASYRNKETEKVAEGIRVKKFEAVARITQRKLLALRIASTLEDLATPYRQPPGSTQRRPERPAQHTH